MIENISLEQQPNNDKMLIDIPSAQMPQNPMLPAVLRLTLKKKWYDMILSGEKKEEYREIKMYWWHRLVQCGECYGFLSCDLLPPNKWKMIMAKNFDLIEFKNGYSKTAPTMLVEFKGIEIGKANPEWSDNWKGEVFAISLGAVLHSR